MPQWLKEKDRVSQKYYIIATVLGELVLLTIVNDIALRGTVSEVRW